MRLAVAERHAPNYDIPSFRKGISMDGFGGVAVAKRGRPKKLAGEGTQVRIESDLVSMARLIVASRGTELTSYLSGILRPRVVKDYAAMVRKLEQASGADE
jgi:hypothetical protein